MIAGSAPSTQFMRKGHSGLRQTAAHPRRLATSLLPLLALLGELRGVAGSLGDAAAGQENSWAAVLKSEEKSAGLGPAIEEPSRPKEAGPLCPNDHYRSLPIVWTCDQVGSEKFAHGCRFLVHGGTKFNAIEVPKGVQDLLLISWNDHQMELEVGDEKTPLLIAADSGFLNAGRRIGSLDSVNVTANFSGEIGREQVVFKGTLAGPVYVVLDNRHGGEEHTYAKVLVQYKSIENCASVPIGCVPYSEPSALEEVKRWCCTGAWTAESAWRILGTPHIEVQGQTLEIPWFRFGHMWESFSAVGPATEENWKVAFKYIDSDGNGGVSKDEFVNAFGVCPAEMNVGGSIPPWAKVILVLLGTIVGIVGLGFSFYVCAATRLDMLTSKDSETGFWETQSRYEQRKPLVKSREDVEAAVWAAHIEATRTYPQEKVRQEVGSVVQKAESRTCGGVGDTVAEHPTTAFISKWFDCGGRAAKPGPPPGVHGHAPVQAAAAGYAPLSSLAPSTMAAIWPLSMGSAVETDPLLLQEETMASLPPPAVRHHHHHTHQPEQQPAAAAVATYAAAAVGQESSFESTDPVEQHAQWLDAAHTADEHVKAAERFANLLDGGPAISHTAKRHGLKAVLEAMDREVTSPWMQIHGCRSISVLSRDPDDRDTSASREALSLGAVGICLNAMRNHISEVEVQEAGIKTLKELGFTADGRTLICQKEGIEVVCKSMRLHRAVVSIQEHGCNTLGNLAIDEEALNHIDREVVETIVVAMQKHQASERVQEAGIWSLYSIHYAKQDDQLYARVGVTDAVWKALELFPRLEELDEAQALLPTGEAKYDDDRGEGHAE
mmetsp:Transcript_54220/g.155856  ORF Transcript_54220/g.155856 Transcript_54220/m.155856 type:complete len:834 (-) Transcript_54220:130-2631(-)|eukprot:CAMPEP_0177183248 /NCGR_PEP_ID=MMETSP0367-20130122/16911_1 /TAXON_ID=447022 ORGANISM="Scrippsiella hangoei-like, Strain SHHI-4" /NCGR_SAMPLE_ID=MMETSP0367 /ASSEMBLY_ACC=CAM_ASM_000362 /LENGTH=833 /DNA_ID=CAMNT_0018630261 /DNA_START=59 /DNA_END=2560 /DNA_ORIENTATION=-